MERVILERLTQKVSRLGFQQWSLLTEEHLLQGSCFAFAVLWRFVLESHPSIVLRLMEAHPWFCVEADDARLLTSVLRLLLVAFAYRSPLTPQQMIQGRFFSQKTQILLDGAALFHREEVRGRTRPSQASTTAAARCQHALVDCPRPNLAALRLEDLDKRRRELNHAVRQPLL